MNSADSAKHPVFCDEMTFDWTVEVALPNQNGWHNVPIKACFRLLPAEDLQQLMDNKDPHQIMQRLVVHLYDDCAKPLSQQQTQRVLSYFPVQKAMISTYQVALLGEEAKN